MEITCVYDVGRRCFRGLLEALLCRAVHTTVPDDQTGANLDFDEVIPSHFTAFLFVGPTNDSQWVPP